MINFPDRFSFSLYLKICKYDKDQYYFLFPFLLEKWKIRLAEVCTDQQAFQLFFLFMGSIFFFNVHWQRLLEEKQYVLRMLVTTNFNRKTYKILVNMIHA